MNNPSIRSDNLERSAGAFDRRDAALLVLIAVLVLLFFWRILTPRLEDRAVFPPGDFTDQFWAFRMYEARAFANGRLPLWSEDYNSGHPFLADVQSAVFYPIGLAWTLGVTALHGADFTLLDLEAEAIFHFMLAGIFTFLLARRLIGSRLAALVSAVTFVFGGYLTSYPPQQLAILETATWLPLLLLCLDLALERVGRYYVAAGVVLGIAALAGHPQTLLFVLYASVVFVVFRGWFLGSWKSEVGGSKGASRFRSWFLDARGARSLLGFALVLLIGAGIAAAQWIPTLEYQSVSTRTGLGWAEAARGFPTLDPLQMILPGFASAFQSPLYIGIFPLWLAVLALWVARSREKLFWAGLALGSLLIAFGFYVFAYALFYLAVPGFALFRDQERLALVVSFSLALLAGYGFRDLFEPVLDRARAQRAWALLPAGVTASALMLFAFYIAGAQHSSGRLAFLLDRSGLMVLLFVLASALAAASLARSVRWRSGLAALGLALIVFDLFSVNGAAYNATPDPRYPTTDLIRAVQQAEGSQDGPFRVADEGKLPGHFGIAYGLEEVGGISPLRVAAYDKLLDLPPETVWPLLNVRYVITGRPGFSDATVVKNDGDKRLLALQNALPRAWLVGFAEENVGDDAALAAMQADSFNPRTTAYVAGALPFPIAPNQALAPVTFERRDPEHLVFSFRTPTDELLVVSEVYYPGWTATVDGVPTPILRADDALRAVPVRAGAHRVEMVYDPWSVKIGMGISLATVLALVVGVGVMAWRRLAARLSARRA